MTLPPTGYCTLHYCVQSRASRDALVPVGVDVLWACCHSDCVTLCDCHMQWLYEASVIFTDHSDLEPFSGTQGMSIFQRCPLPTQRENVASTCRLSSSGRGRGSTPAVCQVRHSTGRSCTCTSTCRDRERGIALRHPHPQSAPPPRSWFITFHLTASNPPACLLHNN